MEDNKYSLEDFDSYLREIAEDYNKQADNIQNKIMKMFEKGYLPDENNVMKLYKQYNELNDKTSVLYQAIGGMSNYFNNK